MLKMVHMTFGLLAVINVLVSLYFSITAPERLKAKGFRIVSHIIYTTLIVLGLWLAFSYGIKLSEHLWLISKLIALVIFIGLNYWVVKKAASQPQMIWGCALMLLNILYIWTVASTKNALLF